MEDFGLEERVVRENTSNNSDQRESKSSEASISNMLKHAHIRTGSNASDSSSISRSSAAPGDPEKPPAPESSRNKGKMAESDSVTLPQRFVVKYLGVRETSNLWGIKYTREPVDYLVAEAKRMLSSSTDRTLPLLKLEVTEDGITVGPMPQNTNPNFPVGRFPIESISYGVQDLVYTRVFAMIVVKPESSKNDESSKKLSELSKLDEGKGGLPYRCHVFVTDTRETAKNLTYTLAGAFQKFSQKVASGKAKGVQTKRVGSIDLRSVDDEVTAQLDSEA